MRLSPVPVPRVDPRRSALDPFIGLESEDLIAAAALLAPAAVLYTYGSSLAAAIAGIAGAAAAVPLILFSPQNGRRGYARLLAWVTWLWEPGRCDPLTVDRAGALPYMYAQEVTSDGARGRRRLLPDPPTAPR